MIACTLVPSSRILMLTSSSNHMCRGTSGTPLPAQAVSEGVKVVQMSEHVEDIAAFIDSVIPKSSPPPVLVGHSVSGAEQPLFQHVRCTQEHSLLE